MFTKNQESNIRTVFSWLLPSVNELVVLGIFSLLTLAVSNISFFSDFIFLPKGFHLKNQILDSLNNLLVRFVGDDIARSAVVAIFWAFVGLIVYLAIWILLNFSNELSNDLAATKYVHPRNVDTHSPLRDLLSRTSFQVVTFIVLVFYINIVIGVLLPYCGGMFRTTIQEWPSVSSLKYLAYGLATQLMALHFLVVLMRALLLRKRITY